MNYNLKEMAGKVGCPRRNAPDIAKAYNSGTTGDKDTQKGMRKILNSRD